MSGPVSPRWDPYVLERGDGFHEFWGTHLSTSRDVLFIAGAGFDPRTTLATEAIIGAGGAGRRDALRIVIEEDPSSPTQAYADLSEGNSRRFEAAFEGRGGIMDLPLSVWDTGAPRRRRVGSGRARALVTPRHLEGYTDVVVDVSALPRSLYFPLLGSVLHSLDRSEWTPTPNLHVVVAEDFDLDRRIAEVEPDETAGYLPGFSAGMEREAVEDLPKVWIPILGEGKSAQLKLIYNHILPDEVCPLLPSPSQDPRRGDDLVVEYQDLLFDEWRVEPTDIVYASEQNPFEVYRQILSTASHHRNALDPLGGCRTAVSALSSKLLSLGALLAAYDSRRGGEMGIALAHVDVSGYEYTRAGSAVDGTDSELFTLWLTGECYGKTAL